jgi:5'-3' exonuclease
MGIPSYFSYIIKNYDNILKKINEKNKIDNLYLDSNSIIYDCLRKINFNGKNSTFETKLIKMVCEKIEEYIKIVKPSRSVLIAFDGVAPLAKMNQQRNRRYKGALDPIIYEKLGIKIPLTWDKTAITPGTKFMNKLNTKVNSYFKTRVTKLNVANIIISGSNDVGEGEHKIFEYIRKNKEKHANETTFIYGLDADLIMLALNHLDICNNLYLYRETPEFIKSLNIDLEPNESYIMDIPQLKDGIINTFFKLSSTKLPDHLSTTERQNLIDDYIFICFLLGNDFMPHFPALDIRTWGLDVVLQGYVKEILENNKTIIKKGKIQWGSFYSLILALAQDEHDLIKKSLRLRNKMEKRNFTIDNDKDKLYKFSLLPTYNRNHEKMLDIDSRDWRKNYYKILFDTDITSEYVKEININYLEGLEWCFNYYKKRCLDWNWCYKYCYPPLLSDLHKCIPKWSVRFITEKEPKPVSPYTQLSYVLPKSSLNLIPAKIKNKIIKNFSYYYELDHEISWSFCKYFWESHVKFPHIEINKLEDCVMN